MATTPAPLPSSPPTASADTAGNAQSRLAPRPVPGLLATPDAARWPLHERAAAQAAEATALAGAAPFSLMARAGHAVARLARALAPHAPHVVVLAGPGHNGGDGLVAARLLHLAGVHVSVWLAADPERLPPDAARAWREACAAGVVATVMADGPEVAASGHGQEPAQRLARPHLPQPGLLIDALLGLGAQRAPRGNVAQAIGLGRQWAAQGLPVLAVDLPSGLHPDTGQPLGAAHQVLPATATLCLLTLRPGCFTGQGRDLAGQVWFDDLGCRAHAADLDADGLHVAGAAGDDDGAATAWLCPPVADTPQLHAAHKGSQGDVAVVGGAQGMAGAAWLAASAALAAGAGRVYLGLLDTDASRLNVLRPELMVRPQLWTAPADWLQQRTVVAGCGGGADIATALPPLLTHAARLLLDADALNAVAADAALQTQLQQRAQRGQPTLLTPHPLEAARLLGVDTATVQADRLDAARNLARRYGAVVVLKGSGSVVAAPDGRTSINPSGNGSLATAGTGDVLAGWLGGRWAQHPGAQAARDLHALAEAGVWQHGNAADRHRADGYTGPLLAADLVSALSRLTSSTTATPA